MESGGAGAAPANGVTPSATPRPAATRDAPALPYDCEAPLVVIEEVTRFLVTAATHATSSSACVDGPGHRVAIDEILVCPQGSDGGARTFAATYRVSSWEEGGQQACGGSCPEVVPDRTEQRIIMSFRSAADGRLLLEPPSAVPGLPPDATPPTRDHDGDCYGKSPAFVPTSVKP